jgi:hypothetical protein
MKLIRLGGKNKDKSAIVDDEYYDILNKYKWYLKRGYVWAHHTCPDGVSTTNPKEGRINILMHQVVMLLSHGIPDLCYCDSSYSQRIQNISPLTIDHINFDKLDNRLSNLSYESAAYNSSKKSSRANQGSQYIGVSPKNRKYKANYSLNGEKVHIGNYATEIEAAKAHDETCRRLRLDRKLNFP